MMMKNDKEEWAKNSIALFEEKHKANVVLETPGDEGRAFFTCIVL